MTDEIKLIRQTSRAARATALLNDELLVEAFAASRQQLIDAIIMSRDDASDLREARYRDIKALERVQEHLKSMVIDGKLAQKELDQLAGKRRRSAA